MSFLFSHVVLSNRNYLKQTIDLQMGSSLGVKVDVGVIKKKLNPYSLKLQNWNL